MRHKYFEIRNFKGIENVRIDFNAKPNNRVYTLVGLNESGKTTILEAIHFFEFQSQSENPLELHGYAISDVHKLIPISKRSNFNGEISIEGRALKSNTDQQCRGVGTMLGSTKKLKSGLKRFSNLTMQ